MELHFSYISMSIRFIVLNCKRIPEVLRITVQTFRISDAFNGSLISLYSNIS